MKPHQTSMLATPVSDDDVSGDDRCTPPEVICALLEFWPNGIDLDPCSNPWSLVPARIGIDRVGDSLKQSWLDPHDSDRPTRTIYCNPPFSAPGPFVERCADASSDGCEVIALVRHDSSVAWWRSTVALTIDAICLVDRRLRFRRSGIDTGPSDHASTILLWTPRSMTASLRAKRVKRWSWVFSSLGLCVVPSAPVSARFNARAR